LEGKDLFLGVNMFRSGLTPSVAASVSAGAFFLLLLILMVGVSIFELYDLAERAEATRLLDFHD
jgi:hypothetical protein